jgi:PPE-repeat protein
MVVVVWVIPIAGMVSALVPQTTFPDQTCADGVYTTLNSITTLAGYLIIVTLMSSIYGRISYVARQQRNKMTAQRHLSSVHNTNTKTDTNSTVLIILCSFVCLYLPNTFVSVMALLGYINSPAMAVIIIISGGFILVNSGVNVFIYAVFTRDFKKVFRALFHCTSNSVGSELRISAVTTT